MSDTKQLTLPITGMTCANCVATVERNLKKLDGVNSAVVNLSSERATVDFDSAKLGITDFIARVNRAGYGVATGDAEIIIKRLSDDNDARRLEKSLASLEGVLEAQVNYANEKARVRYVPTVAPPPAARRQPRPLLPVTRRRRSGADLPFRRDHGGLRRRLTPYRCNPIGARRYPCDEAVAPADVGRRGTIP